VVVTLNQTALRGICCQFAAVIILVDATLP
jgi:hypothetical protein